MSSSRQEELASLLKSLRERSPLTPQPHTLTTSFSNAVLHLLSIIYNIHLPTALPAASRSLTILEQTVRIIARLANFPKPVQQLAELDQLAFGTACERNYPVLINMSYGLFPRVKASEYLPALMSEEKASGLEWVGNPKWIIKREVLRAWVTAGVKKEEKMSSYLLLGDAEFSQQSLKQGWQQIWSAIYFWYYDMAMRSLTYSQAPTWHTNTPQNHFKTILEATNFFTTNEDKLTSSLLLYILRQFVLQQKFSKDFRDSYELLQVIQCLPWELLLLNQCFQITAQMMLFDNVAEKSRLLVRKIKKELNDLNKESNNQLSLEMKFFLPQLFSEQELDAYVKQQNLPFWEFGLDEATCARLALQQLKDLNQQNSADLLLNLSPNDLISRILRNSHSPINSKQNKFLTNEKMELIFETISQNAHKLSQRVLKEKPEAKNVEKILKKFSKDWQTIYLLHKNPFDQISLNNQLGYSIKDIIALFNNDSTHQSICQLPSDDVELVWPHLNFLLSYINKNYSQLTNSTFSHQKFDKLIASFEKSFNLKELKNVLVSEVMERLLKDIDSVRLGEYWMLVGEILLQDEDFMEKMLKIPVEHREAIASPIAQPKDDVEIK